MFAPTSQKFKGVIAALPRRRFCGRLNADFSSRVLSKYGVFRPFWQGAMLIHRRIYGGAKDESVFILQTIHQLQDQALIDLHLRFMLALHFHHPVSFGVTKRKQSLVGEPYFFQQRPLLFLNKRAGEETAPQSWFQRLLHLQPFNTREAYRTADSPESLRRINPRAPLQKKFLDFFAAATRQRELADQANDRVAWQIRINDNGGTPKNFTLTPGNDLVSVKARPAFLSTMDLRLASYALRPDGATPNLPFVQISASYPMTLVYSLSKLQSEKATAILTHFMRAVSDLDGEATTAYDHVPLAKAVRSTPGFASPYSFPPEMKLAKPPLMNAPAAPKNNVPSASAPIAPLPRPTVTLQDLDIQKLTNRVYDEFERKLRNEKERRGL